MLFHYVVLIVNFVPRISATYHYTVMFYVLVPMDLCNVLNLKVFVGIKGYDFHFLY